MDGLLTITLDRPDRMNAYTATMMNELIDAFDRSDGDDDVRVVLITGAERAFCAGADIGGGGSTRVSADLPDVFSDPQPSWAAELPWAD